MARIVDYHVAYDEVMNKLNDSINALIGKGWQPFGSMQVVYVNDSVWKYQPMVRYEEPVPTPKPALPPGITLVESSLPGDSR